MKEQLNTFQHNLLFPGAFVFVPGPQNVTVMFLSGVGVEVHVHEGLMAVTVLLPPEFANRTQGLLGRMNSDPSDDLMTRQGEVVSSADSATPEEIFTFGAGCECRRLLSNRTESILRIQQQKNKAHVQL